VDVLLIDIDPATEDLRRRIPSLLDRYRVPSLALVPDLGPTLEQDIRALGVSVVRRRPDLRYLAERSTIRPIVSILRATVLVHGGRRPSRTLGFNHPRRRVPEPPPTTPGPAQSEAPRRTAERVLVIGASTGGPPAVKTVLSGLGLHDSYAILIVQHISEGFTEGYVRWLRESTGYDIRIAQDARDLEAGSVLVAPGNIHLALRGRRVSYDHGERRNFQRPSVDVLFETAAQEYGSACVAVLLTGMGRDGAEGCRAIRGAGGYVIVQDEASSAVWGMPKAAVDLDAAHEVLPIEAIAERAERKLR